MPSLARAAATPVALTGLGARGFAVLAVLVVHERPLERVAGWSSLGTLLAGRDDAPAGTFRLAHVLIYDNSSSPVARPTFPSPHCSYLHDAGNGGTAAAYRAAARMARSIGADWLLLLDHDTRLPLGFFEAAQSALATAAPAFPVALLPWVRDGERIISPARLTRFGGVRPLAPADSASRPITAIASGSLLRLGAVEMLDEAPQVLWLDYVDHWLFAQLARSRAPIAIIDCMLQHDLSVTRLHLVGDARLRSILDAESAFVASLARTARISNPWRLLARALRVLPLRPRHARTIARHALKPLPRRDPPVFETGREVSVVVAVYNGARFIAEQFESVISQLAPDDELLVVDDASTDGSFAWLERLDDQRLRVLRHSRNRGVRQSFEDGLRLARHDIVFLCDQDDVWLPDKRATVVAEFALDPRALVVVSDAEVIDASGALVAPSFMALRGGFRHSVLQTLVRNRYLGCAMAVRRALIDAALPIPARAPMHDMWLGALGSVLGHVRYVDRPLLRYRRHEGNVSPSRPQGWWRMLRWRMALLTALAGRLVRLAIAGGRASRRAGQ